MKGSEKQIAWANNLKEIVVGTWEELIAFCKSDPKYDPNNKMMSDRLSALQKNIETINAEEYSWNIIDSFRRMGSYADKPFMDRYKVLVSIIRTDIDANCKYTA